MITVAKGGTTLADGCHDVPRGSLASVVTSLEMTARVALRPEISSPPWQLRHLLHPEVGEYRRIYRRVGDDWLWFSRLAMKDAELGAIIHSPDINVYHLQAAGGAEGLLELDFRVKDACELTFLGLSEELIGGPAGRWLMNRAIEMAWARPIGRFWVHTCTNDHPAALDFYRRSGFVPYRLEIEVVRDPRLTGLVPHSAARHIPLIG